MLAYLLPFGIGSEIEKETSLSVGRKIEGCLREMPSASRARLTSDNECKHEERERFSCV